jgi:hypothetical protein
MGVSGRNGTSDATGIPRIGGLPDIFGIIGFNDVIAPIKGFITNQLKLDAAVAETFNGKYRHILTFVPVE